MATRLQIEPSTGVKIIYSQKYDYQYMLNNGMATYGDLIIEHKTGKGGVMHIYDTDFYFSGYITYDYKNLDAEGNPTIHKAGQDGFVMTDQLNDGDVSITGGFFGKRIDASTVCTNTYMAVDKKGNDVAIMSVQPGDGAYKYLLVYSNGVTPCVDDILLDGESLVETLAALRSDLDEKIGVSEENVSADLALMNQRINAAYKAIEASTNAAKSYADAQDASLKNYIDKQDASLRSLIDNINPSSAGEVDEVSARLAAASAKIDSSIKDLIQVTSDLDTQYGDLEDCLKKIKGSLDTSISTLTKDVSALEDLIKSGGTTEALRKDMDSSLDALRTELLDNDSSTFNSVSGKIAEVSAAALDISIYAHDLSAAIDASICDIMQQMRINETYSYSETSHTKSTTDIDDVSTVKEALDILLYNCYYSSPEPISATFEGDSTYFIGDDASICFTFRINNYDKDVYSYVYSGDESELQPMSMDGTTAVFDALVATETTMLDVVRGIKITSNKASLSGEYPEPYEKTLTCSPVRAEFFAQSADLMATVYKVKQLFLDTNSDRNFINEELGVYTLDDINLADGEFLYIAVHSHDNQTPILSISDSDETISFDYIDSITFDYGTLRGAYDVYRAQIAAGGNYHITYAKSQTASGGDLYWSEI